MTPNPPSGTPRNWKSKFQAWLTRLTGAGLPPVSAPSPTPLAPQHPFLAQEPVSEANRPGAVAQAARTRQLMDRICAVNNANVTRNYGTHTEDLTKHHQPTPLSIDDMADAKKLLQVQAVLADRTGIKPAPRGLPAHGVERRRQVRQSHNYAMDPPYVPDLPSVAAVQAQIASVTGYEPPAPAPSYDSGGGGDFGGGGASSSWD
ncbi:hypothetical protein DBR23_02675 [Acidovorax sp. HMWF018]|uniref:hypothetical protein n=1 Tax=Acidovorax sp. HMWF018 TaxID=2056855 RepID=UPI000D38D2A6|nr:hypothetical protein [Acidovorax sp. HMWF018]PTT42804.1 hypothetical protein DBR23_02675 [Acidovorax sp. HMWF018]